MARKYVKYTDVMLRWLEDNQASLTRKELLAKFNGEFQLAVGINAIEGICRRKKWRNDNDGTYKKGHGACHKLDQFIPTDEQALFIKKHQSDISRQQLTDMLNKEFNISVTSSRVSYYCRKQGLISNYRRGDSIPVGSVRMSQGYKVIKIANPREWDMLHLVRYRENHGEIPEGFMVRFLDGDRFNCEPENLLCVPRSANMVINKSETYKTDDTDINKATMLTAALDVLINKKVKL